MNDDMMRDDATNGGTTGDSAGLPAACASFDAALADYLERELPAAERAGLDAHRAECARCNALAADLEGIAVAARGLAPLRPSGAATERMWSAVSARIAAPALPIGPARERADTARSRRVHFDGWRRQLVAAAALVLVTAGVTYSVAHRGAQDENARLPGAVADNSGGKPSLPTPVPLVPNDTSPRVIASTDSSNGVAGASDSRGLGSSDRRLAGNTRSARPSATTTYEREIAGLRRILRERRSDLDSTTVAVLETNLTVIDQAIAQSRAALAKDPASRFLGQQLNSALDKKLELLRTAALLPSRT